jgi:hypothetical protein
VSAEKSLELRVSVDVGYRRHSVAMGLSSGEVLEEFEIDHRIEGFQEFFFSHREAPRDQALCGSRSDGRLQRLCPAARQHGAQARLPAL